MFFPLALWLFDRKIRQWHFSEFWAKCAKISLRTEVFKESLPLALSTYFPGIASALANASTSRWFCFRRLEKCLVAAVFLTYLREVLGLLPWISNASVIPVHGKQCTMRARFPPYGHTKLTIVVLTTVWPFLSLRMVDPVKFKLNGF